MSTIEESFQLAQPRLFGIAYRILGSAAEADDVVQDTWIRWHGTERSKVRDARAFLATITTRLAINVSQSARERRETSVGSWPSEPVEAGADPAQDAERGEALEEAMLVLLEKLSPAERAVYVLREAFDYPYRRIAEVLALSEPYARQLAARARTHLDGERHASVDLTQRRRLVEAVAAAAHDGQLAALERLLVADIPRGSTPGCH